MAKCNSTVACCKNLAHMAHLIKLRFCVWCAKCAKNLAFGTFSTSAAGALIFVSFIACCKFSEMIATRLYDCITKAAKYTVSFKMNGVVLGTM